MKKSTKGSIAPIHVEHLPEPSKTDLARLRRIRDEEIDTSEMPEITAAAVKADKFKRRLADSETKASHARRPAGKRRLKT